METKLIKFLNKEHKKRYNGGMSRLDDTQAIFQDMQYGSRGTVDQKQSKKVQPEQNILDTMELSAIEGFHEQDTLFGNDMHSLQLSQI